MSNAVHATDTIQPENNLWRLLARALAPPLALILAGLAVYANSLDGVFLFDDTEHIVDNGAIRQLWPLDPLVRSCPRRPLLPISLAVNYAWGGLDVTGYHVLNIAVHLATALSLYGLLRRTLRLPSLGDRFARSADGIALAAALIWVVHPLQTQAVTYIVQRCEAMMALFFLLTMYNYVRGATSARPWNWLWYAGSYVTYGLGLASKEVMVTVLPVLWLYDRVFLSANWREMLRCRGWLHLAYLIPLAAVSIVLIPALFSGPQASAGFGIQAATPWEYARSQPGVLLHYLRLSVWPHPQCLDYGWPIENRWLTGIVLPSLVILGLLVASLGALLRGHRLGFLGVAFFLILAPTSSFMPIRDLCFEHRMYLPLACVLIVCVLAGHAILQRFPPRSGRILGAAVLGCVILVLGGMTLARNGVYRSAVVMWTDVIEKTRHYRPAPNLGRAMNNLGDELLDAGQVEQGVEVLEQAVKLNPMLAAIHGNLGRGLMELGQLEAARRHCDEAVRLKPDGFEGARYWQQLGLLAVRLGRPDEAEQHLRTALRLSPRDGIIQANLGKCLADQGDRDEAIKCLEEAVGRDAHFLEARQRLATVLASAGRWREAETQARELIRRSPRDGRPHLLLGLIEVQRGNEEAALAEFGHAVELDPKLATAHLQAGDVHRKRGELSEAARSYEKAVAVDEDLAEAQNNLGGLLAEKEPRRAARHFQDAVKARPDFVEARFNLAATLGRLGLLEQAAEQYRAVLRLRPDFAPARAGLEALGAGAKPP